MVPCCHTRSTMEHYWKYFQLLYAGCNKADLIDQDETLNTASCADRGVVNSSSISGGVVCYNGAIAGSRADYICNNGFVLVGNKATRVCQSDGNWNGSIPRCSPEGPGMCVCSPLFICIKIYTYIRADRFKSCDSSSVSSRFKFLQSCHTCSFAVDTPSYPILAAMVTNISTLKKGTENSVRKKKTHHFSQLWNVLDYGSHM